MPASNSVVLSNPVVTVNSVALTGFATAATITRTITSADTTVFGMTARVYQGTLEDNEITVTLYMTYGAAEVYATLKDLVGTQTTVKVKATQAATSATSPEFTLTNTYLEALPLVNASLGEMQSIDLVFKGGTYSAATA